MTDRPPLDLSTDFFVVELATVWSALQVSVRRAAYTGRGLQRKG
ncbi:hypothetical protein QO004_002322 [Rhizobium mesoamericanum]|nr:hypothetical protein [Rhizobium mesoamericanum]